jgi:hypothetical protein
LPIPSLPPSPRLLYILWFILLFLLPHTSVGAESERDSLLLNRFPLVSTPVDAFDIWSGERKLSRVPIAPTFTSPLLRLWHKFYPARLQILNCLETQSHLLVSPCITIRFFKRELVT